MACTRVVEAIRVAARHVVGARPQLERGIERPRGDGVLLVSDLAAKNEQAVSAVAQHLGELAVNVPPGASTLGYALASKPLTGARLPFASS